MYYPRSPDNTWGEVKAERKIDAALMAAQTPGALLASATRPPLPQVRLFPPRLGYPSYQQRQIGIADIVDVPRIYHAPERNWTGTPNAFTSWSGTESSYSGSSRPSMGAW